MVLGLVDFTLQCDWSIGSGKTAAFLVPMFEQLKTHSAKVR